MRPLILAEAKVDGLDAIIRSRHAALSRSTALGAFALGASAVHAVTSRDRVLSIAGAASAAALAIASLTMSSKRRDILVQEEMRNIIFEHDFGNSTAQRALKNLALRDVRGLMERGVTKPTPSGRTVHLSSNHLVYTVDGSSAK